MTNKEHNILVVDDDYNFLFLLIGIITNKLDKDYVLFTSSDGTDALIKAGKNNIDLIVSDTYMPRMNGYELFQKIREKEYFDNIRFIAMSSDAESIKKIW
ncbi:response regulator [Candidatus Woesearchaeota archaeon]|nr:response regulator [Candidatus Woesearchaeota archaeon]